MISEEANLIRSSLQREILDDTPLEEKRRSWEEAVRDNPDPSGIVIEMLELNKVPCMLHLTSHNEHSPAFIASVIVYLHGGGLVEGSSATSRDFCCRLALAAQQPVISIDYRLAPEHPYPAAVEDVLNVFQALAESIRFKSVSSLGADSTGAALALRSMVVLRERKAALPGTAFFLSPSLDLSFKSESILENAHKDPLVCREVLQHCASLYAGKLDPGSCEISPLYSDLDGLPPLQVHVDADELLLGDASRLHTKVIQQGGQVDLRMVQGLWHVWPTWGDFPEARITLDQIARHIAQRRSA